MGMIETKLLDNRERGYCYEGMTVYRYCMPGIASNMYAICEGDEAIVVDPHESTVALNRLRKEGIRYLTILLTHEHFDHISGVDGLQKRYDSQLICTSACAQRCTNPEENLVAYWELIAMGYPADVRNEIEKLVNRPYAVQADEVFTSERKINWRGHQISLRQAPGHSPGGMLIELDQVCVFTGDNLVNGDGVICFFPGGSKREYDSVNKPMLDALDDNICIFPGHGDPEKCIGLRQYCCPQNRR